MGVKFVEHMGGLRLFSCANCDKNLTNRSQLISTSFTSQSGRAFLFDKVVNLNYGSKAEKREMITGKHFVRDVSCKYCDTMLGWAYEFAKDDTQRYKEGRVILELALVKESNGMTEVGITY